MDADVALGQEGFSGDQATRFDILVSPKSYCNALGAQIAVESSEKYEGNTETGSNCETTSGG